MYRKFYSLKKNPFEITPDPSFLYATKKHNEALAALYYGVRRRKGFVVLTGEVGTGKTLVIRCLLQVLNRANTAYAYVFNSRLNPMEFLQYIAGDLHLATSGKTKSELLLDLGNFLISRFQKGLATVLIADEAHHLSADVLEEIRLLTNLETAEEKLLQILLVGQPELEEKLDSVDLRQLKQRIALRSKLQPLDLNETKGYVHRRLELAGSANPDAIFPEDTVLEIQRQARGYPRLINTLCENALIQSYAKQELAVSPEVIREIATDFRLNIVQASAFQDSEEDRHANEVERAARTLIDLYAGLRHAQSNRAELKAFAGASKQ